MAPAFVVEDQENWLRGWRKQRPKPRWRQLQARHVEESLDLHGMHLAAAEQSVKRFVRDARKRHCQTVRIIVGKGHHSPGGRGVLRSEIAVWLSSSPCGAAVAAFCSASPTAGGDGAILVELMPPPRDG